MKKIGYAVLLILLIAQATHAQDTRKRGAQSLGVGLQVYPAGTIINLKSAWAVSAKGELIGKLGYNFAQRENFGEHDSEEGNGPGFTVTYKRFFNTGFKGWYLEARMGMWFLDIDWQDNTPLRSGNTDISVFQPTLGVGYDFPLKNERIKMGLLVAFGYEVNVVTSGEDVGQGGISLFGLSFMYDLNKARKSTQAKSGNQTR